jgi:hypothetical protein
LTREERITIIERYRRELCIKDTGLAARLVFMPFDIRACKTSFSSFNL